MSTAKNQGLSNYLANRARVLKQKEDTLQTVLGTAEKHLKFVKLLQYALNSLQVFVSPPNREIKLNASIIIRLNGVEILHKISTNNLKNEEIVTEAGDIIWKLISIYDQIDQELAKMFADKNGQNAVIDILINKEKGKSSIPFIRILNGMAQIPQLISKLLDSGLINTVKVLNDSYSENIDIISLNFDTMKKISTQKKGRDLLINGDFIPSIIKNINYCTEKKASKPVLSGLTVLDNLCREEKGKEQIKANGGVDCLSNCLDKFENEDKILKMCAKVYSKIATKDDMDNALAELKKHYENLIQNGPENTKFNEVNKNLVLVSNLMLVGEMAKIPCEKDNFDLLAKLYNEISKIPLEGKDNDFISLYIVMNKYFMKIFYKIFESKPSIYDPQSELGKEYAELNKNIQNSVQKIWKSLSTIIAGKDEKALQEDELMKVFNSYYCNYNEIIYQHYMAIQLEITDNEFIESILYINQNIILEGKRFFGSNEMCNYISSNILRLSVRLSKEEIPKAEEFTKANEQCYEYIMYLINNSRYNKTLSNCFIVLYDLIKYKDDFRESHLEDIIIAIANFMQTKSKYRFSAHKCLQIMDIFLTDEFLNEYKKSPDPNNKKTHAIKYTNCICSVMTRPFYIPPCEQINVENVNEDEEFALAEDEIEESKELEEQISKLGTELLLKFIDMLAFKELLKKFKEYVENIDSIRDIPEKISDLENITLLLYSLMGVPVYYKEGAAQIIPLDKNLLEREIRSNEFYKKDKENEKKKEFPTVLAGWSNRLRCEIELIFKLNQISQKASDFEKFKKSLDIIIISLSKTTDEKNVLCLLNKLKEKANYIINYETKITNSTGDKELITDRIITTLLQVLRKVEGDETLNKAALDTIIAYTKLKPELCNNLVKGGCPRNLISIFDNSTSPVTVDTALDVMKLITFSNEENLNMLANQNVALKIFETRAKYFNDDSITTKCDQITREISKLPGQEAYAQNLIEEAIKDFNEKSKLDYTQDEVKQKMLDNLEVINSFTATPKQYNELAQNTEFINNLIQALDKTIEDSNISQVNEKLLSNEVGVLEKLKDTPSFDINQLIARTLNIFHKKSNYRDILLNNSRRLLSFIKDDSIYQKYLADKMNTEFIDLLFDINDNYLDDAEVTKEINNILCLLCLKNEKNAEYIKKKGGLINVLEDLNGLVYMNDENSQQLKSNLLKMLNSLLNDDESMNRFIKINGHEIIAKIIKNELTLFPSMDTVDEIICQTNEELQFNSEGEEVKKTENYFAHSINIMKNGIQRGHTVLAEDKTLNDLIHIAHSKYPDSQLIKEICEIYNNEKIELPKEPKDFFFLLKVLYSIQAKTLREKENINEAIGKVLLKASPKVNSDDTYSETIKPNFTEERNENLFVTYLSLLVTSGDEYKNVAKKLLPEITEITKKYLGELDLTEGLLVSVIRLAVFVLENNKEAFKDEDVNNKLILLGEGYLTTPNSNFELEYFEQLDKLNELLGKKDPDLPSSYSSNYMKLLKSSSKFAPKHLYYYSDKIDETKNYKLSKPEDKELSKLLQLNLQKYYGTEEEHEEKKEDSPQFITCLLKYITSILLCENITDEQKTEELNTIYNTILAILKHRDSLNIIKDQAIITQLFDLLNRTKTLNLPLDNNSEVFPKIINSICENTENDNNIFDSCLSDISKDLEQDKHIDINIESLKHLSKFPTAVKNILKNKPLYNKLKQLYDDEKCPMERRTNLAIIFNNIMKNSYNIDQIIVDDPSTFKVLEKKLTDPNQVVKDNSDLAATEIDTLIQILKDQNNFQQLSSNKHINVTEINNACKNYQTEDEAVKAKVDQLKGIIEELSTSEEEQNSYNTECQLLAALTAAIDAAFKEHLANVDTKEEENNNKQIKTQTMDDFLKGKEPTVEEMDIPTEKKKGLGGKKKFGFYREMTLRIDEGNAVEKTSTIKKSRLSIISTYLLFKPANNEITSPLSISKIPEMSSNLDSLLAMIRLLDNSNRNGKDQEIKEKRGILILEALRLLKQMSICKENHKAILELGLINFIEKLSNDQQRKFLPYIATLDILKNCTLSEDAFDSLIESPVLDKLVEEVLDLYNKPEEILASEELKNCFLYENMILTNLCKTQKGGDIIFKKIGIEKLKNIGLKTGNIELLTSIIRMLTNYLRNTNEKLDDACVNDIIEICHKGLTFDNSTANLLINSLELYGEIIVPETVDRIREKIGLIGIIINNFCLYQNEPDFILPCLHDMAKLVTLNKDDCLEIGGSYFLDDIARAMEDHKGNNKIILKYSNLLKNLIVDNSENCQKISDSRTVVDSVLNFVELYSKFAIIKAEETKLASFKSYGRASVAPIELLETKQADKTEDISTEILMNFYRILAELAKNGTGLTNLTKSSFMKTTLNLIEQDEMNPIIIQNCLNAISNYFEHEDKANWRHTDIEILYSILKGLQRKYYMNIGIMTAISKIAGFILRGFDSKIYTVKYYMLVIEGIKCLDWNVELANISLEIILYSVNNHVDIKNEIFEPTYEICTNLLNVHSNEANIVCTCYQILTIFTKDFFDRFDVVSIAEFLNNTIAAENIATEEGNLKVKTCAYEFIKIFVKDYIAARILLQGLLETIMKEMARVNYSKDMVILAKILECLIKHKSNAEMFMDFGGIDKLAYIMKENIPNSEYLLVLFRICRYTFKVNDMAKEKFSENNYSEITKQIINENPNAKVKFEGEILNRLFEYKRGMRDDKPRQEIDFNEIAQEKLLKNQIIQAVKKGELFKIISPKEKGKDKEMKLFFSNDLMKIHCCKEKKLHMPLSPKYTLEVQNITKIVPGHGTTEFKKLDRAFSSAPKPELCFSIIGVDDAGKEKSINVICKTPSEVTNWVYSIKMCVNYVFKQLGKEQLK